MTKTKYDVCPKTPDLWRTAAAARSVGSIHQLDEVASASSLGVEQFLALKVLWQMQTDLTLFTDPKSHNRWPARLGTTKEEISDVRKKLKKEASWKEYLKAADQKGLQPNASFSTTLGRFAMVLQNQKIVTKLNDAQDDREKVWGSPMKLRSDDKKAAGNPIPLNFNLPAKGSGTDSGDPQKKQPSPPRSESRSSSVTGSDHSKGKQPMPRPSESRSSSVTRSDHSKGKQPMPRRSESSPTSTTDTENSKATTIHVVDYVDYDIPKAERVATADEQVVNTAAISFLQSLFVHDELRNAYWSPQRKGFAFGETTFQAITDGHLQIAGSMVSAALLEVKARRRPKVEALDFKIEWQESAQMALWIRDEPSSFWTTEQEPHICR
jgi:hypothetical protein